MSNLILGIDLGTSYSCAGAFVNNSLRIVESASERKMLNYVAVKETGMDYGELAKNKIRNNFKSALFDAKLFLAKGVHVKNIERNSIMSKAENEKEIGTNDELKEKSEDNEMEKKNNYE